MISQKLFSTLLILALVLIVLQLVSGVWLFIEKFGVLPSEVFTFFAGDEENFIPPKSIEGLAETAVPHFLAISTTLFAYGHFLLFTDLISEKKKKFLILTLFVTSSVDIFSPLGMIYGYEIFAWLKVLAFWSFEILMALLLYILSLFAIQGSRA